jgi:hypothetical protein
MRSYDISPLTKASVLRAAAGLALVGGMLALGGCADSKIFDNNCTGNAMIENPQYCTDTLHPNAGPWANSGKM